MPVFLCLKYVCSQIISTGFKSNIKKSQVRSLGFFIENTFTKITYFIVKVPVSIELLILNIC